MWLPRPACGRVERLALATTLGPLQVPGTLSPPADSHLPTHHFSVTPPTATLLPQGQLVTMAQLLLGAGRAQEAVLGWGWGWLAHRPVKMLFIGSQGLEADTQGWSWGAECWAWLP